MSREVLVPVADGSEDIETVTLIDVLRRAEAKVTVASVSGSLMTNAARGTKIVCDVLISECKDREWDLIALPGGMPGATNLAGDPVLVELLKKQKTAGKLYAAICASPAIVLQPHLLLEGRRATCYPSFRDKIPESQLAPVEERVVVDGNCVTSQGPATAIEFSLRLVQVLFSQELAEKIGKSMLV